MTETVPATDVADAAAKAEASADPWEQERSALAVHQQLAMIPDADFAALLEGADFVKGATLVEKETLIGKPLIITEAHFYPGKGKFFVACTAVTQDNVTVVFNDGSTGIRRQVVAYLTSKGLIDPGPGEESGPETRYDRLPKDWKSPKNADEVGQDEGFPMRLVCPRGLRKSEYEWEGDLATTFYLG